jgi:hypothetical protein
VVVSPGSSPPEAVVEVFHGQQGIVGSGDLWLLLPSPGSASRDTRTGRFDQKTAWYRAAPGDLRITATRLDGPGDMLADIPPGYSPVGVQPTGLLFSAPGCWRVTGTLNASTVTVTMDVREGTSALPALPPAGRSEARLASRPAPPYARGFGSGTALQ